MPKHYISMFKTNKSPLTIAILLLLVAAAGCSKLCNSGYEGVRCNELVTAKFIGIWSAVDTPGNLTYSDTINQGTSINDINLSSSFAAHHFAHIIRASVATNAITIPYQQPDSGNTYLQGTGIISDDHHTIMVTYQIIIGVDSPQIISNYAGTWVRQN
jgi:hypothetical protein